MKKTINNTLWCLLFVQFSYAQIVSINKNADPALFREVPTLKFNKKKAAKKAVSQEEEPFKPSIQVGSIVHMYASYQQNGFGPGPGAGASREDTPGNDPDSWSKDFTLYRARVLVGGKLSKNGSFFLETDLPTAVGRGSGTNKNVKVSPIILDAQYEHKFGNHMAIAGLQLVSHNRNGLQGAAGLLANDFTFFQYPNNLFSDSPLQGNFGRDLGVNTRGFFLDDKLEYRFGMFTGRNTGTKNSDSALRYVGRVAYNFLDAEKDYYYAGTKLGAGKTAALALGFDAQGTYTAIGADFFLDVPLGEAGSITVNSAFSFLDGGTDTNSGTSFVGLIPRSTTQFLELGYYFKKSKLQPWIRYEKNNVNADGLVQIAGDDRVNTVNAFDDLNSATVLGGGLNYWFAGYNTNIRLSYTTWTQENTAGKSQTQGQIWLQTQFFIF